MSAGYGPQVLGDGNPDGTTLGASTSEKVSVYGVTPIVQRASAAQATVATTAATSSSPWGYSQAQANGIVTLLNEIQAALVAFGIIKGGA